VGLQKSTLWRRTVNAVDPHAAEKTAIRTQLGAIFVSLELSRSTWVVTSLLPGGGGKMSKHSVRAGDVAGLLERFSSLTEKARARTGGSFPIIVVQEAGLDGFWLHRALVGEGIESWIVDPASIATSRRRRRAKTDRIDGEALVRALLAFKRGEPRVCAMLRVPAPEEEDRRRIGRERKTLIAERVEHVNRIKGLLFSQGALDYEPMRRDRRARLDELRTGDGRPLPQHLKAQVSRELDRLELLIDQIKAVDGIRDSLVTQTEGSAPIPPQVVMLTGLKGIGPEFANVLYSEGLFRHFDNRRQVAAYSGLAPTPWQSGSIDREQGVSKAGNPRLRSTMVELAWLWTRHQPESALSQWFRERAKIDSRRKATIVALARKLLVALWKYVTAGVAIEGAVMKAA
jgi:transposase